MKYIGAHINKQKTLLNTMINISTNDGNALQFFASNPRSIHIANIEKYKQEAPEIIAYCKKNNFKLIIHSPYTVNLAKEFKNGYRDCDIKDLYGIKILLNELILADILGAVGTVVHVGKYTTLTYDQGLENMRNALKYIINNIKDLHLKSKIILETPAGQGTELLTNLKDFLEFYNSFSKEEKNYFKICIDTAHVWSSGYELKDAIGFQPNSFPSTQRANINYSLPLVFVSTTVPKIQPFYRQVYYKPNNPNFAQQGGVSSSTFLLKKKFDTITNNAAVFKANKNSKDYGPGSN
jgi:endonuclease IV